ncbi:uncharacterized protein [Paramormyrops kingsleyae]|uniref:uncharacterized protein n=1 Tax=Paramormyrops kingsleyae TaxID=1676925 RepID=UPI003B9796DD
MHPAAFLHITVCGALWCVQYFGIISAAGPLAAPSLTFSKPVNGTDIRLFSVVVIACTPPKTAPYPLTLNLGKPKQPLSALLFHRLTSTDTILYSVTAVAQHEGDFVCWYNVSRTGEVSPTSSPVNLTISSLPQPTTRLEPAVVFTEGNYTIFCDAPYVVYNTTFRLYCRNITDTASEAPGMPIGSLTANTSGVQYSRLKVPPQERLEYFCDLEADYNHRTYRSPLSPAVRVTPEMAPVRLVPQFQGLKCAGRLEMFIQGRWGPVCHGEDAIAAMWNMANVTCRELGCGTVSGVSKVWMNEFGLPAQQSLVGPLQCTGNELRLRECLLNKIDCYNNDQLEVICSDFVPPPRFLVTGYEHTSYISIYNDTSLEMICTLSAPWLGDSKVEIRIMELSKYRIIDYKLVQSGEAILVKLWAPIPPGKYACFGRFRNFHRTTDTITSNVVTIAVSTPPNRGLIAGAVISVLLGAGILTYLCIWRVSYQ